MRATVAAALVLLLLVPAAGPALGAPPNEDPLRAHLRSLAADSGVPGMAWAVVDAGAVRTGTLGTDGHGDPVRTDTPFLWGSVAKPVTATAVMQLVEDGSVALADPVIEHLPWLVPHRRGGTEVTVHHLLTHTSGYSSAAGLHLADRERSGPDPVRELARELGPTVLVAEPGGRHRYSAVNFLVLGALVEEVTGRPFARVLDERVLGPAGMVHGVTTAREAAERLPPGHRLFLGRAWRFDGPYDEAGVPFGYLGGSIEDAAALVRTLSADRHGTATARLLAPRTLEEMWRPAVAAAGASYGLGWRTTTDDHGRVVWHSGATPGYFATLVLAPEDDLGVVVLANGYSVARDAQLNEAGVDLLRIVRGERPEPAGPDRVVLLLPWGLLVTAAVPLLAAALRSRRPRPVSAWGSVRWVLALAALAAGVRLGLPAVLGEEWRAVSLWAPGVAVGVRAVVVGCLLGAVVVVASARRRRVRGAS